MESQVPQFEAAGVEFHPADVVPDGPGGLSAMLCDREVAEMLGVTVEWLRSHVDQIPGHQRLGMYYRFRRQPLVNWLGTLEPLLDPRQVAEAMRVPISWVYAKADEIPGVLRLGRYARFRPAVIRAFLSGSGACQ